MRQILLRLPAILSLLLILSAASVLRSAYDLPPAANPTVSLARHFAAYSAPGAPTSPSALP